MPEVEAKFIIQSPEQIGDALRMLEQKGCRVEKGPTEKLTDRYFDTPEWSILHAGWTLRRRECGGRMTLTLKARGSSQGGVFVRDEIEQRLSGVSITDGELPPGPVAERVEMIARGASRRELFRIVNRRSLYMVELPGDTPARVKLGVDRIEIKARTGNKTAPGSLKFRELEVELDEGAPESVNSLARLLSNEMGLLPAQLSKFERGMQVAGFSTPTERWSTSSQVPRRDQPMLELVYYHLDRQFRALKLQEPRAWEGLDPEGVHQMRVAIRRIRSVLRAFRDMLRGETVTHLNAELRWLAHKLGEVRDADVYWEVFHACREMFPQDVAQALEPYEQHLEAMSSAARSALIDALASERYANLLGELENFVTEGPTSAFLRRFGTVRISDGDDLYIQPAINKLLKFGRGITPDSPASKLHKLRIEGKRLRYLLEFFSDVQPKRWTRPLKAARRLQDVLGEHQDAFTARERLERYAQSVALRTGARELLLALGRLLQREEDRLISSRKRFPKVWARVERDIAAT